MWFDRLFAIICIIVLLPLLVVRSLMGLWKSGQALEKIEVSCGPSKFNLLKFGGFLRGRSLACLFNVTAGDLLLVGEGELVEDIITANRHSYELDSIKSAELPCIVNLQKVQRQSGTKYDDKVLANIGVVDKIGILLRYALVKLIVPSRSVFRPKTFNVFGVQLDNFSMNDAKSRIIENALSNTKSRFAFVNADCLNLAYKNTDYRESLRTKTHVFADGIGLQIGAQMLCVELQANVNGTDLLPMVCNESIAKGLSLYLLGGKQGVAEEAAEQLLSNHPGLSIAGTQHGYFDESDSLDVIEKINESNADIVLVAFGAPKQDLWIDQYSEDINSPVLIGVGGLLDYYTDRISRSPKWLQDIGGEWIWRLKQEPVRLWKRYLVGNPLFLYRIHKQTRVDDNCVNYRRFNSPHKTTKNPNRRYRRQQNVWLLKLQALRIGKRLIDLVGSASALLLLSPLLLSVALIIKLESPGPVLFHQKRVGRYGQFFTMLKFRSMRADAESIKKQLADSNEVAGGVTFKMKEDPRITKSGIYLRRYSIDELPQLINVLRGDMSLVGPRPPVPSEVDLYSGWDRRRLEVIPGITGLWQVSGRSDTTFEQQVDLDIQYLESHGLLNDILILLKTVPAVLLGKGAY